MIERKDTRLQGRVLSTDEVLNRRIAVLESVLAVRERELLELKGPCSGGEVGKGPCLLHYAHSGPCDIRECGQADCEHAPDGGNHPVVGNGS